MLSATEQFNDGISPNRLNYNFVRRHSSRRFGGKLRTPAMQAGLTKCPHTLPEIFPTSMALKLVSLESK